MIHGRGGNDQLFGGADGDYLDGGTGTNSTDGGTGTDNCVNPERGSELRGDGAGGGAARPEQGQRRPDDAGSSGRSQLYVTGSSGNDTVTATYAAGTVSFALSGGASFDATVPGCSATDDDRELHDRAARLDRARRARWQRHPHRRTASRSRPGSSCSAARAPTR